MASSRPHDERAEDPPEVHRDLERALACRRARSPAHPRGWPPSAQRCGTGSPSATIVSAATQRQRRPRQQCCRSCGGATMWAPIPLSRAALSGHNQPRRRGPNARATTKASLTHAWPRTSCSSVSRPGRAVRCPPPSPTRPKPRFAAAGGATNVLAGSPIRATCKHTWLSLAWRNSHSRRRPLRCWIYALRPVMRCTNLDGVFFPAQRDLVWWIAAHNQRPSRNAMTASDGRYLPGRAPSGAIRSTARCLRAGSACW